MGHAGAVGSSVGPRSLRLAVAVGRAEPAVQLLGDDLLHVLGDQPHDQVDDALLAAFVVALAAALQLILDDGLDVFGDQPDDGVDDALLLEVAATAPVAMPVAVVA